MQSASTFLHTLCSTCRGESYILYLMLTFCFLCSVVRQATTACLNLEHEQQDVRHAYVLWPQAAAWPLAIVMWYNACGECRQTPQGMLTTQDSA